MRAKTKGRHRSDRATIDRIGDFMRRTLTGEEHHVVAAEISDRKSTLWTADAARGLARPSDRCRRSARKADGAGLCPHEIR